MADSAPTDATRIRLLQGIATAAAQGTGLANTPQLGEQLGLSREQTAALCADLRAAGLLHQTPTQRFVSVTPHGWLWWQRLSQRHL